MTTTSLNIHAIIDHCCGLRKPEDHPYTAKQEALAAQFKKHGLDAIKPDSIQKWIERGQIPGDRLVDLHVLAKKQGKKLNLYRFIGAAGNIKAVFG